MQIRKYSPENMLRYFRYTQWIRTVDPRKIKFLDEVLFKNKGNLVCAPTAHPHRYHLQ